MIRIIVAAFAALFSLQGQALAWGQIGHRVTGLIAEKYLSQGAAREVRAILGPESLAEGSTWPDFMRASPEAFWQEEAGAYHYVTVPAGKTYKDVGAPPQGDAVTALEKFRTVLRDPKATREQKALALRFAVHIIGDLHQPLHAGNGADRGGNDVKLTVFGQPTNLHALWDSGMIDREQLSYSELGAFLAAKITSADVKAWSTPDPLVWIGESASIRDTIYPSTAELDPHYAFEHIATVHQRLEQGGVRIAAWLNETFAARK